MQVDKKQIIKLTNDLYRLTLYFPKKEPLRYKLREVAASFLADPNEKDLGILDNFLEVSLSQTWVSPHDILTMKRAYAELVVSFDDDPVEIEEPKPTLPEVVREIPHLSNFEYQSGLTERQEKIIGFLKENGKAQVWQIKEILPDVTKRTLRRDFESLLHGGKIERVGERNDTFYQLKSYIN